MEVEFPVLNRITVNEGLLTQLGGFTQLVELCDAKGHTVGHFVPVEEDSSWAEEKRQTYLSEAQQEELKRRAAEHEKDPQDLVSWDQVKADAQARFQK